MILLAVAGPCRADAARQQIPPLFSVTLDEPFPSARQTFDQARELILQRYYSDTITEEALYRGALEGMLHTISPPHNKGQGRLFTPQEYGQFNEALQGSRTTLGVDLKFNQADGSLTVTDVVPGSPADGVLRPYDRIMRIDGKVLRGLPLKQLNGLLDGPEGSRIALTVVRDIQVLELGLSKGRFKAQNLVTAELPGGVHYLRIKRFYSGLSLDLHQALTARGDSPMRLVIDLRGNPGGVFAEGVRSAETFLGKNSILLRTVQRPNSLKRYVSGNTRPLDARAIILVDKHTASAAEIFSAALRDHGVAQLVGTSTYGKATMEQTMPLDNGYWVKFIVGAMYSPRGVSWFDKGLLPDFYVETATPLKTLEKLAPAQRLKQDLPLATAWKLLQSD